MGFVTNRGKARELNGFYRDQNIPSTFRLYLVKDTVTPTVDTNVWSDISAHEVTRANGYSGPVTINRNTTDWDTLNEDDTNDRAGVLLKDIVFTASGGDISNVKWAALTDDNSVEANREVILVWDLNPGGGGRTVTNGQTITLQDCERRSNNA